MKKSFAILFIILIPGIFISCTLSDKDLKTGWWKGDGYIKDIGDVIDFNKGSAINNDTILYRGKAVGIILRRTIGRFGDDNEIEVISLDGKTKTTFHQK